MAKSFWAENISNVQNMRNTIEDLHNEELHGEMSCIFKHGVEGFIGESRFDSMSEEINEDNIVEGDEEVGGGKILNEMRRIINKGMHVGMMT